MNRRVATALIGTGKVAHVHAQAFATLPESRFVAVFDRDRNRAEAFAAQYGVTPFWDLDAMLGSSGAVAASVCTPHPTHPDMAVACADAGVHVLVEKPLAVDVVGAERIVDAARRSGVSVGVISQRRWYPPIVRMRAAIDAGAIGRPAIGIATVRGWRDPTYYELDPWRGTWAGEGGGVLVNQAVHQLDLLLWFMGPAALVGGFWSNVNHPSIEVDDSAVASIRFANGAIGSVIVSNSQRPGLSANVHVHGDNGTTVGTQTDGGSTFVAGVTVEVEPAVNDVWTVAGDEDRLAGWQAEDRLAMARVDPVTHFHSLQIGDFLRAVRDGREPAVTAADGLQVVALVEAIYQSQAEERLVSINHPGQR